jgi:RNA polymerase sigma-70 factor (sigma-E family)
VESDVISSPGTPPDRPAAGSGDGSGDGDVTELFRAHHVELVRLALLMVGDLGTAEDVVQDAFEQLYRRWHSLRRSSSALDYARSAVLNRCRSVLRRRGVARRHEPRLAAPEWREAEEALAFELRSEFAQAVRALTPRQREVVVLRYYLDLSIAETAAALRISEGAVRSTASRGLDALSRAIGRES